MLDQIDESIDMSIKMKSLKPPSIICPYSDRSPEQKVSLLKLRKNSKSFGDCTTEKLITIYWYDQEHDSTYEFSQGFSEILCLGDICNWVILKLKEMNLPKIDVEQTKLYLPKRNKVNQMKIFHHSEMNFNQKIVSYILRQVTPPQRIEPRSSYSNSLNKENVSPSLNKKLKTTNFFCFCNSVNE